MDINKNLKQIGYNKNLQKLVLQQARLASKCNLDAIVCSAHEVKKVKSQIDDLVNDPNFIRIGELLAEKRRLQRIEDEKNKTK